MKSPLMDIRDWQQASERKWAKPLASRMPETYLLHHSCTANRAFQLCPDILSASNSIRVRWQLAYMGSSVAGEMLIITKDQYEILRKEFRNEAYLSGI